MIAQYCVQVPKGLSWQPESVDAALCHRVAGISRVSVPAVSFQLAGLATAAVWQYLRTQRSARLAQGGTGAKANGDEGFGRKGVVCQWKFVDELDSGLGGSSPGRGAGPISDRGEKRIEGESQQGVAKVQDRHGRREDAEMFHNMSFPLLCGKAHFCRLHSQFRLLTVLLWCNKLPPTLNSAFNVFNPICTKNHS